MADAIDALGVRDGKAGTNDQLRTETTTGTNISALGQDTYNMSHANRGCAVIINNKTFISMGERTGTDVDAKSMYELFDKLGFEYIYQKDNMTARNMKEYLTEVSKMDHKDNDCFVCVILSHGEKDMLWGTDKLIPIEELVEPFKGNKCPSLAEKPKLFFIQACRGNKLDHGMTVSDASGEQEKEEKVETHRIPTEADFLMAYSVSPGYYSWRHQVKGSWFIQAVFEVFKTHWKTMDLLSMMTRVNRKVAYDFHSQTNREDMNKKKQIPCITSMLTKDVYFFKK